MGTPRPRMRGPIEWQLNMEHKFYLFEIVAGALAGHADAFAILV